MTKPKILITGGSGLLATNWANFIKNDYQVILALHHKNITLKNVSTIKLVLENNKTMTEFLASHKIDIVINTVGLANIEYCEKEPELAYQTNAITAKNVAIACQNTGAKLIHISTDHLFGGEQSFYPENAQPNPLNTYAKTKLKAEEFIANILPSTLIVRTNFFGWGTSYHPSFSDTILKSLNNNQLIKLFNDVFYTPISIEELVRQTHLLINKNIGGIVNIVSDERLSKYEFGLKLARIFNLDTNLIQKISLSNKQGLTTRPKDMSLSNAKLKQLNGQVLRIDKQLQNLKKQEKNNTLMEVAISVIPYGKHYIDEDDVQAVAEVLRHGMLTQGPKVVEFETKIASYVGTKYAVAVANGTAALHLSALAMGLKSGDSTITSPNTFVATSNAILYVGAKPIFVDIDAQTLNINLNLLEQAIVNNPSVRAIFPVHFAGLPCEMDKIAQIANKYNLTVIEDAAHAFGASYNDSSKVGNCRYSDMTIFSFHPVKGIAAGEGGIITTNDEIIYKQLLALRSHGITKGNFEFPGISTPDNTLKNKKEALENGELKRWYYEMQQLGFNYRITDIQCALAISQMDKIDEFLKRRKQLAKQYDQAFTNHPHIKPQQQHGRNLSSHHIYIVLINFKALNITRHQFMQKLAEQGIGSQVHYIPVFMQPYYQKIGYNLNDYPVSYQYYQNTLSIPLYYGLSDVEQVLVINAIKNLLR